MFRCVYVYCAITAALCGLSGWLWSEPTSADARTVEADCLLLEASLFELEVKGDPDSAIAILNPLLASGSATAELYLRTRVLELRCLLALGRNDEALACYRDIRERSEGDSDWVEAAEHWIPETFIVRSVPWRSGELHVFEVSALQAKKTAASVRSYALLCTELTGSDDKEEDERVWKVKGVELGSEFREFEVILDRESLQIRATQLTSQPLYPIERKWFGIGMDSSETNGQLKEPSPPLSPSIGWMLRGLWLQQCGFVLGFEQSLALYDLESGFEETSTVTVSSMELLTLQSGIRKPCWIADVDLAGGQSWESYAFANETDKAWLEFRSTDIRATRRYRGSYEKVDLLDTGDGVSSWCRLAMEPMHDLQTDAPAWLFLGGSPGVRCYLGQGLLIEVSEEYRRELFDLKPQSVLPEPLQVERLIMTATGEQIGWQIREERGNNNVLVVFGSDNEWKQDPVSWLQEFAKLLMSGRAPSS